MTAKEFNENLSELKKEFDDNVKKLKLDYIKTNARFKKGDKIRLKDKSIVVETISGTCFSSQIPAIYYMGAMLTKDGTPRKDGQTYSIFEQDGIELI